MRTVMPEFLIEGDTVAIVAPAGSVEKVVVEQGVSVLKQYGFSVVTGKHVGDSSGVFAGADNDRAGDLQAALDDDKIKAIFFARGGYGSLRTLLLTSWSHFLQKPKWLIGFSDITVFHSFLHSNNIASVHGVMPAFFSDNSGVTESFMLTLDMLKGSECSYSFKPHGLNRPGKAIGKLAGGNLSVLMSLRGTYLDASFDGSILFIEDIGEYYYHLDRMMMNLKAGNVLQKLAGLIAGYFTDIKNGNSDYGMSAYEIISKAVEEYNYPVMFGFPSGHRLPNYPLMIGAEARLEVSESKSLLSFVK